MENHFKWGWDGQWYNRPKDQQSQYQVSLLPAGKCGSFHDEAIRAIQLLVSRYDKPIMVALSGGLDSQVICLSLMELNVPFTAITMEWTTGDQVINHDDVQHAISFCGQHSIDIKIQTVNLIEWLAGPGSHFAEQYGFAHYRLLTQTYYLAKYQKSHCIIIGGGNMSFDILEDELMIGFETTNIQQFMIDNQIQGTANFLQYTPEIFLSQIDNKIGKNFLSAYPSLYDDYKRNSKTPWWSWRVFTTYVKPLIYHDNWEGLVHRGKLTGFETFLDTEWKAKIYNLGTKVVGNVDKGIAIPANDLLDHLRNGTQERIWTSD